MEAGDSLLTVNAEGEADALGPLAAGDEGEQPRPVGEANQIRLVPQDLDADRRRDRREEAPDGPETGGPQQDVGDLDDPAAVMEDGLDRAAVRIEHEAAVAGLRVPRPGAPLAVDPIAGAGQALPPGVNRPGGHRRQNRGSRRVTG